MFAVRGITGNVGGAVATLPSNMERRVRGKAAGDVQVSRNRSTKQPRLNKNVLWIFNRSP